MYQSMRNLAGRVIRQLRTGRRRDVDAETARQADALVARASELNARFEAAPPHPPDGAPASDATPSWQAGKLLFTGKDFVIIDFDGDSRRPLADRRCKRPPCATWPRSSVSFAHAARQSSPIPPWCAN